MLLSTPIRLGNSSAGSLATGQPTGRPLRRGSDGLRRWIRRTLSRGYSSVGVYVPAWPPPVPPVPPPMPPALVAAVSRIPAGRRIVHCRRYPTARFTDSWTSLSNRLRLKDAAIPCPAAKSNSACALATSRRWGSKIWTGAKASCPSRAARGGERGNWPCRRGAAARAEYLRRGRPVTACRRVFVRHTVPEGTALNEWFSSG